MKQQLAIRTSPVVVVLALLGLACGTTEPGVLCNDLEVDVTAAEEGPVFSWDPGPCRLGALLVYPADGADQVLWSVLSEPGDDTIEGPVTYGVSPAGAAAGLPAEPLSDGVSYVVQLMVTGENGPGLGYTEVGRATFVHADAPPAP